MPEQRKSTPWLAQKLRERISRGVWRPGQLIPGRRTLALEFKAALTTVERAVATLMAEGLLRADDRRGTFVSEHVPTQEMERTPPRTGRSAVQATIGLVAGVIPYASAALRREQWQSRIVESCEHVLAGQAGINHVFINLIPEEGRLRSAGDVLDQLRAARVDAVIVIDASHTGREILHALSASGKPIVRAAFDPLQDLVPEIYVDGHAGGALAVQHLRARGYRHLTFLRPFINEWVEPRFAGALGMADTGGLSVFPLEPDTHQPDGSREQAAAGLIASQGLLARGIAPGTGIIAPNDAVAMSFLRAAADGGLIAGRDYGLIGFDDWERDAGLTSLRPPLEQIGSEAAAIALRMLQGDSYPSRIAIPHRLIARTSTRPWNHLGDDGT